jgi:hypothetical protein
MSDSSEQAIEVSFEVFHLIAESLRPFTEGDSVKNYLLLCHKSFVAQTA